MQFPGQGKPPVGVIFDCDMGNSIDDALALALLYGFDGRNEARLTSVSSTKSNLASAAFCEAIGRFYAGAVSGAFGGVGRGLPVGLAVNGKMADDTPMLTVPLSKKNAEGSPLFPHGIHKLNDTAEILALLRNAFTSQQDQNCMVVVTGPATNIVSVLDLPRAKELITRKVRYLVITGGAYPEGQPEFNFKADISAAKKLFAEWPTPIIASGSELGAALQFPGSSTDKDFAWSPAHPVVEAYRAYKPMPYDAPVPDMVSVLYAIRPQESYFKLSDTGTITVLDDGRTKFTAGSSGKHRYLIFDPAQKQRILKTITEIASAKPVPRVPRFRQQQNKDEPPKPPADNKPPAQEIKPPAAGK